MFSMSINRIFFRQRVIFCAVDCPKSKNWFVVERNLSAERVAELVILNESGISRRNEESLC